MVNAVSAAEYRGKIAPRNEKAFTDMVRQAARAFGWMSYHTHNSKHSEAGYPDIRFVHPVRGQKFYAELKVGRNEPTDAQRQWIAALTNAGEVVFVWKPEHWDEIVDVLSGEIDL